MLTAATVASILVPTVSPAGNDSSLGKIKGKWIDKVRWKSFDLISSNKLKGDEKLWWGFRKDNASKIFPEEFYCELELLDRDKYSLFHIYFDLREMENYMI